MKKIILLITAAVLLCMNVNAKSKKNNKKEVEKNEDIMIYYRQRKNHMNKNITGIGVSDFKALRLRQNYYYKNSVCI